MEILHIAHRSDWERAEEAGSYTVSTRGLSLDSVGFIHASGADQVAGVARAHYADDPEPLVVLVLAVDRIVSSGTPVRYEDGGDGQDYPHIYGPILPAHVVAVLPAGFAGSTFWWGERP